MRVKRYNKTMISKYTYKGITWIDLASPTENEINHIQEEFSIPISVTKELYGKSIKIIADLYPSFIYLILYFPEFSDRNNAIAEKEIDFIIGDKFIITTHYEKVDAISSFYKTFEASTLLEKSIDIDHAGFLFFHIIRELYSSTLNRLNDINSTDHNNYIFKLINLEQAINTHKEPLESFGIIARKFFGEKFEYYVIKIKNEHEKVIARINYHKEFHSRELEANKFLLIQKILNKIRYLIYICLIILILTFLSLWL